MISIQRFQQCVNEFVLKLKSIKSKVNNLRSIPTSDLLRPRKLKVLKIAGANTLMPASRLSRIWNFAHNVGKEELEGAFVECGTYKGGSAAMLISNAERRDVWLFDSWDGCPEPTEHDVDRNGNPGQRGEFSSSYEAFEELLSRLPAYQCAVHIRKGWFQDTVPSSRDEIGKIALLHLDGDWYESTKVCLESLYDGIVPGGILIIDDYGYWNGCKKAVDEFFENRSIQLVQKDDTQAVVFVGS